MGNKYLEHLGIGVAVIIVICVVAVIVALCIKAIMAILS
jgi:hypothetical protein